MAVNKVDIKRIDDAKAVEFIPGIFRRTLVYNDQLMLCHFTLTKGATIPLHNHKAVQNGYVIKGKVKFIKESLSFIAEAGCGYCFDSEERHGAEILENSEFIECFSPLRNEYID